MNGRSTLGGEVKPDDLVLRCGRLSTLCELLLGITDRCSVLVRPAVLVVDLAAARFAKQHAVAFIQAIKDFDIEFGRNPDSHVLHCKAVALRNIDVFSRILLHGG